MRYYIGYGVLAGVTALISRDNSNRIYMYEQGYIRYTMIKEKKFIEQKCSRILHGGHSLYGEIPKQESEQNTAVTECILYTIDQYNNEINIINAWVNKPFLERIDPRDKTIKYIKDWNRIHDHI